MKAEMVNGSVIGNYRVQQKLGETVDFVLYSGKALDTDQDVLLKAMRQPPALIRLALPDFQGRTTRFMQLRHPNLCAVREILRDENAFYIVTDLHRGVPLSEILSQKKQLPYQFAASLIEHLLELLTYLHEQKVTCLDLRPSNLYLGEDKSLQLADAGLIQLLSLENQTTAPETVSALEYTAPERILYSKILGTKVDTRADIYAVGVLFYELLTGRPPLRAESRESMIRAQIEAVPLPLNSLVAGVPAPIEQVIMRALEKSPERRFAAAETMQMALQRAKAPEAGLATLEPSLAFLMESLQLADANNLPSAFVANAPTGGLRAKVQTGSLTGSLAESSATTGKLTRKTGELSLPRVSDKHDRSLNETGSYPTELPTLRPRGASLPLAPHPVAPQVTSAALAQPSLPDAPTLEPLVSDSQELPVLELSEIFAHSVNPIEEFPDSFEQLPADDSTTEPLTLNGENFEPLTPVLLMQEDTVELSEEALARLSEGTNNAEADANISLTELFGAPVENVPAVEIEILPESIIMIDPDGDPAFDELRSTVLPSRWKKKMAYAAAGLGALFLVGCSVFWMVRPGEKTGVVSDLSTNLPSSSYQPEATASPNVTASPTVALMAESLPSPTLAPVTTATVLPEATIAPTPVPTPRETPTPKPTATPTPLPTATPTPKPNPTPKSTPVPEPLRDRILPASSEVSATSKTVKARSAKTAKPSLSVEKERRKRAILDSFTQ